jgi:hypothetical protein
MKFEAARNPANRQHRKSTFCPMVRQGCGLHKKETSKNQAGHKITEEIARYDLPSRSCQGVDPWALKAAPQPVAH